MDGMSSGSGGMDGGTLNGLRSNNDILWDAADHGLIVGSSQGLNRKQIGVVI